MDGGYRWRGMSEAQRAEALARRRAEHRPWHAPPHRDSPSGQRYHIVAACHDHRPHIGRQPERMDAFADELLSAMDNQGAQVTAWCVLPNHYHALLATADIKGLLTALGQLHGRSSHAWNGEEDTRGRTVFYRSVEQAMRSDAHFRATLNYVHHNPVHHGYVRRAIDWPWSSVTDYVRDAGAAEARRVWREYPVLDYGRGWDDPAL